jgi:Trypsin-like peptidase domain
MKFSAVLSTPKIADKATLTCFETLVRPSHPFQIGRIYILPVASFDGLVLLLCVRHNGHQYPWGSAIFINPGIAVTAAHVMNEFQNKVSSGFIDAPLLAFGPTRSNLLRAWEVRRCTFPSSGDICVLSLEPRFDFDQEKIYRCPVVSHRLPSVGERVFGISIISVDERVSETDIIRLYAAASVGEVTELYPIRRDYMLDSPSFSCSAYFAKGMSGGPVFDASGHLLAVVSSGFNFADPDAPPVSFASVLGWVSDTPVVSSWFPSPGKTLTFGEMAARSFIFTPRPPEI